VDRSIRVLAYSLFVLIIFQFRTVDIRAKRTDERTREYMLDGMRRVQGAFKEHDLIAYVRLETYEGERYFHVSPLSSK